MNMEETVAELLREFFVRSAGVEAIANMTEKRKDQFLADLVEGYTEKILRSVFLHGRSTDEVKPAWGWE